jgi:hypothetical protein
MPKKMNAIDVKPDSIWSDKKYTKAFCVQYYKDDQKNINQAHWRMRTGEMVTTTDKQVVMDKNLTETMINKKGIKVWIVTDGPKMSFINGYLKGTPYKECHAPVRAYVDYILKEKSQKKKKLVDSKLLKIVDNHEKQVDEHKKEDKKEKDSNSQKLASVNIELERYKKWHEADKLEIKKMSDFLTEGENPIFNYDYQCINDYDMDKLIKNYTPPIISNNVDNSEEILKLKKDIKKLEGLIVIYKQYIDDNDETELEMVKRLVDKYPELEKYKAGGKGRFNIKSIKSIVAIISDEEDINYFMKCLGKTLIRQKNR